MKTAEQMRADYEQRSEILTHGLRRDDWIRIAIALQNDGAVGQARDILEFLKSKKEVTA